MTMPWCDGVERPGIGISQNHRQGYSEGYRGCEGVVVQWRNACRSGRALIEPSGPRHLRVARSARYRGIAREPRGKCLKGCNGEVVRLVTLIQRPLRPTLRTQVARLPRSEKCHKRL